ncbi:carbohydrate kinase [Marinifilum breve]|uniref:Carbohydrate kinase n=1 Tax=Marinifilum breve TaxID=2184082 RepID=A0A2V3ZXE2_9BACT|nr:PfkB family carbohydrate kinase [Marinifilum breve]PXY01078.1 carbohydrate kinase [Marinifilum breve]
MDLEKIGPKLKIFEIRWSFSNNFEALVLIEYVMRKVYTIGDCVLDLFFEDDKPIEARPGGSFLNSSVSLGRFGIKVSLISELGEDRVGMQIIKFLEQNGVDTQNISRFTDTNSNLALAFLDEHKNADYAFYKTRSGKKSCIVFPDDVKKDDVILFGSFLAIKQEFRPDLLSFLKSCKEKGAIIIYDPNFRAQHLPLLNDVLPYIKENMALADIVKASNEDFELICGVKSAAEAKDWLKGFSSAVLIYTANKNGVSVFTDKLHSFAVPQIQPVSTVGAGDTFNACIAHFIVANNIGKKDIDILSQEQIQKMVDFAVSCSQHVCMSFDNFISFDIASKFNK